MTLERATRAVPAMTVARVLEPLRQMMTMDQRAVSFSKVTMLAAAPMISQISEKLDWA